MNYLVRMAMLGVACLVAQESMGTDLKVGSYRNEALENFGVRSIRPLPVIPQDKWVTIGDFGKAFNKPHFCTGVNREYEIRPHKDNKKRVFEYISLWGRDDPHAECTINASIKLYDEDDAQSAVLKKLGQVEFKGSGEQDGSDERVFASLDENRIGEFFAVFSEFPGGSLITSDVMELLKKELLKVDIDINLTSKTQVIR